MTASRPFSTGLTRAFRLLGLLGLLVLVPRARAQEVSIYSSADSVRIGDRFSVSIVVEHNFAVEPIFPDPAAGDSMLGDLEILARKERVERYAGAAQPGTRIDSIVYEVTTFALDTAFVPSTPVRFVANEDTFSVSTPPLRIHVQALVTPGDQAIRDLAPIVEFPRRLWPWILLALLGLLALGAAVYYFRKRRRPVAAPAAAAPARVLTPYEEAAGRLHALEAVDLSRPENVKPFYVELSDLLRAYLARRLGVAALEETTRELVRDLQRQAGRTALPPDAVERVRAVLELSDLVKFADHHPPADKGRGALREARATLDAVETALRPAPEPAATT